MPCGGIYPCDGWEGVECFHCGKPIDTDGEGVFCEEWDAPLHDGCVPAFLKTAEGEIVVAHEHTIERR
jgi:hypothetical protein